MELYDDRGRPLRLRGPGRSGGEGTVYAIETGPLWVAKIYHASKIDAELHAKVAAMAASPPVDPAWDAQRHRSIAWVERLLFHDAARTRFAGFTMPAVDTRSFRESHLAYDSDDRQRVYGRGFTWRNLMTAAANLSSAVAAVHAAGHRVGDLRETNVLVSPAALVTLIDCDSFQVRDRAGGLVFHTRVGSGEYLPRELQGADFRDDHDRTYSDRFALAVLLFKLLMLGVHPFQARGRLVDGASSPEAKIVRGHYPYRRFRPGVEPPEHAPPAEVLPPAVRALFERSFVDGHRHPRRRPEPSEWFAALRAEAKRLRRCSANEHHWFAHHQRACPWCRFARARGADPFPAPGAIGRQLTVAPAPPRPVVRPTPPAPARGRLVARASRWVPRARITRRRALVVGFSIATLVGLVSPLGHGVEPPQRTPISWEARARGACPFDPRAPDAPANCRSVWRLGPIERSAQQRRSFFLLRDRTERIRIAYEVEYRARGGCALPWVPNMEFNARAPVVCLATCPERIELRSGGGPAPLVAAGGVGARDGPLRCGRRYRGSWTFDVTDAADALVLHYPAFDDLPLPA